MLIVVCILAAFAAFSSFVLREFASDEREGLHRMLAGRIAYLAGSAVLTFAIVIQELQHMLDAWLVAALVIMILTKIVASLYSERNN